MKHSYSVTCECKRCLRERARREAQRSQQPGTRNGVIVDARRARQTRERGLDRWARAYYETDGGIDQFNPEDR